MLQILAKNITTTVTKVLRTQKMFCCKCEEAFHVNKKGHQSITQFQAFQFPEQLYPF
jgi:hypothetical protein